MFKRMSEIKAANRAAGYFFFSPDTMRFFNSRVETGVIGGRYFITSEQYDENSPREYTARRANDDGTVETVRVDDVRDRIENDRFSNMMTARQYVQDLVYDFEYVVEGNYGSGWEAVTFCDTRVGAAYAVRDYRANEPGTPFRTRRVKKNNQ